MGMAAAKGKQGGRRRRGVPRYGAMAEINMTPFIDVMLVLLIIFMVAAPLLATGVPIDLPQTRAAPLNIESKPVSVTIDEKGGLFLMEQPVKLEDLAAKLKGVAAQGFEERIYLRGAKSVSYGRVAEIMSLLTSAGYKKAALVNDQEKK